MISGFPSTMLSTHFRVVPLETDPEFSRRFVMGVTNLELNLVLKRFEINLIQGEDGLDPIWYMLKDKMNFQIDGLSRDGQVMFSIIMLDCVTTDHNMKLGYDILEPTSHKLALAYREHIRFGPNGTLSVGENDPLENADRMMAKLLHTVL